MIHKMDTIDYKNGIDPEVVGELKEALIKGKAGFISSSLNLLKCIIGAGILSLPWTVSVLGMLTFTGILLPAAACGLFSIYLLLHCCDKFHVFTYERVTENAFKKRFDRPILGRKIAAFFVSTTALGSICSYSFIIKSQLPELIKFLLVQLNVACFDNTIWFLNGNNILILIMAFIIFPLTCFKKLDFLKYSSGSGFFVMVFCILVIVTFKFLNVGCESVLSNGLSNSTTTQSNLCNYVPSKKSLKDWASFKSSLDQLRNDSTNGLTQGTECQAVYFKPMSQTLTDDFGKAVSSIFFAFNCHDTLLSIYDNLKHGSKPKMMKVASSVMSVVVILYMVTAFFGYLTWYEITVSDILLMYSGTAADSFAIFFARLAVCLSVLFSIPVYMYAVRGAVWRSIFTDDEEMDQTKFDSQRYLGIRMGEIKHHVFNILFLILVFMLVSVFADSLSDITWASGLSAIIVYVVLPPLIWFLSFDFEFTLKYLRTAMICSAMLVFGIYFIGKEIASQFLR